MTTLADKAILSGADNRPPMLEKDMYDSWKSIIELYMMNKQHGRMIFESVENGPLIWLLIEGNGMTRPKKYSELSATEAIQADCDIKATNIILQGLPPEVYVLLYDEFDKFTYKKGETLHDFYLIFLLLLNDMNIYNMKLEQFQVTTKFLNTLPPEWRKYVTDVKLVGDLHTTNIDHLHAYLGQHEFHANEGRHTSFVAVLQGPTLQEQVEAILGNKGRLFVITIKEKDTCPNSTLNLRGNGMIHGLRKKCYWYKLKVGFCLDDVHECEDCWFIHVGLVGVPQRQDETSEPLLYAGWMVGPYRCKDATRGRNDDPVTSGVWNYVASQPKKRGTSKDVVASLDQRVAGVETSMAELKNQEEGLEGLDSDFTSMREDFRVALNTLSGDLKREIHGLRDSFMGRDPQVRKEFGDEVLHTTSTVGMENIERGTETIDTQAEIVAASKSNSIRRILRTRRRVGFVNSSNPGRYGRWAKTELERRGVQDLSTAIVHAEALIDFSTRRESSKPKDRKVNQEKGRGEKNAQSKVDVARLKYQIFMT
ncbi:hypothetical protein Tco_0401286 [Tanacetum coccineum]